MEEDNRGRNVSRRGGLKAENLQTLETARNSSDIGGNRIDRHPHREDAPKPDDQANMRFGGRVLPATERYSYGGTAPQARIPLPLPVHPPVQQLLHGDVLGDPGTFAASDSSRALARMPMAELQALHKHWTESLEDQEAARDVNLEKIGELVHQLVRRKRGSVNQDVLATAIYLAQKHQALDAELHHFMRTGSRRPHTPSWNSQMSVPAAHNGAGRVRRPQRTVYCGQIFPAIPILRNRVPRVSRQDKSAYHLHCIICNESFGDHRAIFLHFPGCVEDNGNLRGYCWYHHPSIEMDKIPDALIEQWPMV